MTAFVAHYLLTPIESSDEAAAFDAFLKAAIAYRNAHGAWPDLSEPDSPPVKDASAPIGPSARETPIYRARVGPQGTQVRGPQDEPLELLAAGTVLDVFEESLFRDRLRISRRDEPLRAVDRLSVVPLPREPEPEPFRLRWPLEKTRRITQAFGANPQVYKAWGMPAHEGIDFAVAPGEKVLACADGEVVRVDVYQGDAKKQPYGNSVRVQHTDGYLTVYAHFSKTLVRLGEAVRAGQPLGIAGSTGNSTGLHLHLTLKLARATARGLTAYPSDIVDPTPYLEAP